MTAVQLFLHARYVEAALRTNAELAEALDDVIASAEARYVTGGTAHHDVLLATAERALIDRDALVLRRALAVLHAQMNELRGRPADEEVPPLVDDQSGSTYRPLSLGAALAQQPELLGASSAVAAADARVRVAETLGHPDLSLQVMAMQSFMPDVPSNVGAMVGVTVPIYWKGKQRPTIVVAVLQADACARPGVGAVGRVVHADHAGRRHRHLLGAHAGARVSVQARRSVPGRSDADA